MRAAVLTQTSKPLEIFDLEAPSLAKGQVLVKMAYTGICRSQINEIKGLKGEDPYLPHTLGHEGSGVVVAVGEGVTKVKPNDRVIATWIRGEGLDASPISYRTKDGKKIQSGPISTFMDLAVIAENRLVIAPEKISLKEAALFGCAIPTGAGIVYNDLNLPKAASVAIFGIGGIGSSALIAALSQSPKQLIAIDRKEKLPFAKLLGATHTIDAESNVIEAIYDLTKGVGVDFAIEAVGLKNVMETAFRSVKDRGGLCILAGNVAKGVEMACNPFDFIKGKRLIGSWGGGVVPDRDIPHFFDRLNRANQTFAPFISHVLPLNAINEAVDLMQEQKAARILIDCGASSLE